MKEKLFLAFIFLNVVLFTGYSVPPDKKKC